MAERMLRFTSEIQASPDKRDAALRTTDFDEIYARFAPDAARTQASRCSQCGVPFCSIHCPLGNNIPDWLKLTVEGRLRDAYEVSAATNNFPEICGRICPQDRLCEGNCVIERDFSAVTIGAVERYLTDTAFAEGWVQPPAPARARAGSIGIIGAGPAGLAAADQLRRQGYAVEIYDRHDRAGGLLIYGIPGFKLEKSIVQRRQALLEAGGIRFHLGVEIGRDVSFADLRARHDAVLIATGVYRARQLTEPGHTLPGIVPALEFLIAANRTGLGDRVPDFDSGRLNAQGRRVVVVGGGDTAMDCVRTAIRQGATSVQCLYRRDRENMPGSLREVAHAEEEGVQFLFLSAPLRFEGTDRVRGVSAQRMRLCQPDASGRRAVEPTRDGGFTLEADLVIEALGFDPEDLPAAFASPDLACSGWGTLRVDRHRFETSLPGVFAAGDIVRGASLVVWAIRDGRDAAAAIHRHLQAVRAPLAVAAE